MVITNGVYDALKFIGTIVLPASSVLVVSLGDIWGLPYKNEIAQTIVAVQLFLNSLLGITSVNYYKAKAEDAEAGDPFKLGE